VTKTFKLHPDQKEIVEAALTHVKEKTGTAGDMVALELISQHFMGTGLGSSGWRLLITKREDVAADKTERACLSCS
jgi:hypothetical protein